jgi:hypothetical protein
MPIARSSFLALACWLLVASCGKSGGQTGDEDAIPGTEFYGQLGRQQGSANYPPASGISDLVARSERIVLGHAVALRAGRRFVLPSGSGTSTMETVVLEIAVERALKGADAALFLEFDVGSAEANIEEHVPADRVIAFANRAPANAYVGATIEGAGDGLSAGATLYALTTPQGFALAGSNGGFSQPFEPSDGVLGHGTFDDLVERVAQAVEDQPADASVPGPDGSIEDASTPGPDGSSNAGSDAPGPDAALSCAGEGPSSCPAACNAIRAIPFDATNACLDYNTPMVIGCTDGVGPPVVVCIERIADGARFMVGQAWPFPQSTVFRTCDDASGTANEVLTAPSC